MPDYTFYKNYIMNKNLFFGMFAAACMLLQTSCSNDELEVVQSVDEAQVTFSLGLEGGIGSRAISDGTGAKKLVYAVYKLDANNNPVLQKVVDSDANGQFVDNEAFDNGLTETVNITLAKGQTYQVAFWAQNPSCTAYTTTDLKNVGISYEKATNNNETRDAFFKTVEFEVSGNKTIDVELKRPFAQINVGVTSEDWEAAVKSGIEIEKSKVIIDNAATSINLLTGVVGGEETVTYGLKEIPNELLKVDTDGNGVKEEYNWLSMSYILVNDDNDQDVDNDKTWGDDRATLNSLQFTFAPKSGNNIEFKEGLNSVPVQRNWRTNILGKILTGDIQFNITIDPAYDDDINVEDNWADGYSYDETTGTYHVYTTEGMIAVAALVDEANDGFVDKTILLENDIDLSASNWNPMGDNRTDKAFKGIFDGQNHMISGAHITGDHCWDGSVYGSKEGWGLFSVLDGASVKNLKMDGATFASYTVISGAIAGYASNTTFENIEISNTKIAGYNWYTGGVVGWAEGECTFKDINLDNTVSVGTLWDSHGQCAGGIAGGVSSSAKITIEDCNIACVLDVINDVTSNYKWYIYRVSGMIIGNTNTTEGVYNTVVTATATNVTCKNVTVTYGDWMNYHYCQGYWNRGWGRVESSDYVSGIDHTQCNHPAGEQHYVCIPFDQLFGGSSNGSGHYPVKGLASFPGVTVHYPLSYTEMTDEVSDAASLKAALEVGKNAILTADVDCGTTQLALDGSKIDLNGHTLTTNMTHGGISMKNGASIKNGTIEHTNTVAAIKAFNVGEIENVTIKTTCATTNKTVTAIAVQQGGYVGAIKNVTVEGVSQGIEVGYQATVDQIEGVTVNMSTNGTAEGIGLVINGGKVGKAKGCTFTGDDYGIKMLLKGVFAAGLELEDCDVTGATASIKACDEKGISNISGSLNLTYDAATTLNGPFVWDFEDECKSVVTLNKPQ